MKGAIKRLVLSIARRSHIVQRLANLIVDQNVNSWYSYAHLRETFIDNGAGSFIDKSERLQIVQQFEKIDRELPIATTPIDGIVLAELAFCIAEYSGSVGDIVECGCFAGGSTAKLSLIADVLDRKVFVFDSFEGLPEVGERERLDYHCRRGEEWVDSWDEGRYATGLDAVKANVEEYGGSGRCIFIKGWFQDTLTKAHLPDNAILVFSDVDIASSSEETLTGTWPCLIDGGVFVTHDIAYIGVLRRLNRSSLWEKDGGGGGRPIVFGSGYGICDGAPHMGYMVKGENVPDEYLKKLTLVK